MLVKHFVAVDQFARKCSELDVQQVNVQRVVSVHKCNLLIAVLLFRIFINSLEDVSKIFVTQCIKRAKGDGTFYGRSVCKVYLLDWRRMQVGARSVSPLTYSLGTNLVLTAIESAGVHLKTPPI